MVDTILTRYFELLPGDLKRMLLRILGHSLPHVFIKLEYISEFVYASRESYIYAEGLYYDVGDEIKPIYASKSIRVAAAENAAKENTLADLIDITRFSSYKDEETIYRFITNECKSIIPIRIHRVIAQATAPIDSDYYGIYHEFYSLLTGAKELDLDAIKAGESMSYNSWYLVCPCRQMLSSSLRIADPIDLNGKFIHDGNLPFFEVCHGCGLKLHVPFCYREGKYIDANMFITEVIIDEKTYLFRDIDLTDDLLRVVKPIQVRWGQLKSEELIDPFD
jgi:hypothetical protein